MRSLAKTRPPRLLQRASLLHLNMVDPKWSKWVVFIGETMGYPWFWGTPILRNHHVAVGIDQCWTPKSAVHGSLWIPLSHGQECLYPPLMGKTTISYHILGCTSRYIQYYIPMTLIPDIFLLGTSHLFPPPHLIFNAQRWRGVFWCLIIAGDRRHFRAGAWRVASGGGAYPKKNTHPIYYRIMT